MKILLMAGHGAGDPGAIGNGYNEADVVREIVPILRDKLTPYADVTVFDMKKNPYKYLKSNSFNFKEYDYVFEVHLNAFKKETTANGKTKGVEILVHPTEKGVGVENAILKNIEALGFTNRGIKRPSDLQNMNICKGKQGVSYALIEVCFIDDVDDMALYNSKKGAVIDGIAQGIVTGFSLNKTAQSQNSGLHTVEEIVACLNEVGIISDVDLWLTKLKEDKNAYWLAKKTADYIKSH